MDNDRLDELIFLDLDGEATEAEREELHRLLEDDRARAVYNRYRDDHQHLAHHFAHDAEVVRAAGAKATRVALGATPRRWVRRLVPPGAAAALLLVVLLLGLPGTGPIEARVGPVEVVRQNVAVTVFNEHPEGGDLLYQPQQHNQPAGYQPADDYDNRFLQPNAPSYPYGYVRPRPDGMAVVKDRRIVKNLRRGTNRLSFADVAATIDPTSVMLRCLTHPRGVRVVEQNFEFDLADADALLRRYIDKQVTCVGRDGVETSGHLASFDTGSIVLSEEAGSGQTTTLARHTLQAVRMPEVPKGLRTRPTLVWELDSGVTGEQVFELSYICGKMSWAADYVFVIHPGRLNRDLLELTAWVQVENRCGSTYPEATLKLIAGDVNRVRDPWAPQPMAQFHPQLEMLRYQTEKDWKYDRTKEKKFVEKSFFEYHLYTLSVPSTLGNNQVKQLGLVRGQDIVAHRRYDLDPAKSGRHARLVLVVKNEEENNLGMPLPRGRVRFMMRDGDRLEYLGEDTIDHTASKEKLELSLGGDIEVVGRRKLLEQRAGHHWRTDTVELVVRNHKARPTDVRVIEHLMGLDAAITKSSMPHTRHSATELRFEFTLEPDTEKTIVYTVHYTW